MKIRLLRTMFAPDISGNTSKKYVGRNGRVLARGHRLRKGIHEVPDEWADKLPRDAQILEGPYELEEDEQEFALVKGGSSLVNQPEANAGAVAVIQLAELTAKAETDRAEQLKVTRLANLAKARAAKKQKQEEKDANA